MQSRAEVVVTFRTVARINFEMDDELHARAKSAAALSGRRLYRLIEEAVLAEVERFEDERRRQEDR